MGAMNMRVGMPFGFPMLPGLSSVQGLLGPHTSSIFAPAGGESESSMTMLQQHMIMASLAQQLGSGMPQLKKNTIQVKMTETDLRVLQMHRMQQRFAMLKAMQDLSKPKPRVVEASQVENEDTAEEAEELLPSRDELDVAKHQVKQDEIDSLVLTSLE